MGYLAGILGGAEIGGYWQSQFDVSGITVEITWLPRVIFIPMEARRQLGVRPFVQESRFAA